MANRHGKRDRKNTGTQKGQPDPGHFPARPRRSRLRLYAQWPKALSGYQPHRPTDNPHPAALPPLRPGRVLLPADLLFILGHRIVAEDAAQIGLGPGLRCGRCRLGFGALRLRVAARLVHDRCQVPRPKPGSTGPTACNTALSSGASRRHHAAESPSAPSLCQSSWCPPRSRGDGLATPPPRFPRPRPSRR